MKNEEEQKIDQETLNFDKPSFKFVPNEYHDWRQEGPFLVCKSCPITHSVSIGMDKILVGFDEENKPIIKKRQIVEDRA